jgi:flagellar biosynthetic protein FliP
MMHPPTASKRTYKVQAKEKALKHARLPVVILAAVLLLAVFTATAYAEPLRPDPTASPGATATVQNNDINTLINLPTDPAVSVQIVLLLTILSLAPSILIMLTGFTRIIIVLSFTRNALGVQQMPPNQVLVGLALFLTFFVMAPVINQVNETAYQPFVKGEIT